MGTGVLLTTQTNKTKPPPPGVFLLAYATTYPSTAEGEDFALAGKAISEYTKDGATAFNREAQLERKASHDELEKKLVAKGLLTKSE